VALITMAIAVYVPGAFGRRLAQLQRRLAAGQPRELPPHIALVGPFEAAPPFLPLEQHVWEACHYGEPFDVELAPPRVDQDEPLICCDIVSGAGRLGALREALLQGKYAPPRESDTYQPRCVVARIERSEDLEPARREVAGVDVSATFTVERIELVARYPNGEWYERDFYTLDAAVTAA
jgi:2'-5' RNA ligase